MPTWVEMQVTRRPSQPERVVPLRKPEPPKPVPKPKPEPKPKPVIKKAPRLEPVAPRPVPNSVAPPKMALPEPKFVKPVAGLTSASFVAQGSVSSPVFGAGNTLMARPDTTMAAPQDVQPYSKPVAMADVETEPKLIHTPDPVEVFGADYPAEAKAQGVQGITRVKVLIDERGNVVKVKAVKGPPLLREAAESLARRFKYKPATVNGKPVSVWWYETIPFRITN